jgi:hypothetical protein
VGLPEDDPRTTPFAAILRYVLGFMGAMALLALAAVWLLKHC